MSDLGHILHTSKSDVKRIHVPKSKGPQKRVQQTFAEKVVRHQGWRDQVAHNHQWDVVLILKRNHWVTGEVGHIALVHSFLAFGMRFDQKPADVGKEKSTVD